MSTLSLVQTAQKRAKWTEDVNRRTRTAKQLDYYYYRQRSHTLELLQKAFPETALYMTYYLWCVDITRRIIDQVAIMFDGGIDITISSINGKPLAENSLLPGMLADMLRMADITPVMDTVESLEKLTGKVLVKPRWDTDHVVLDIITGDMAFVEQDEIDPSKAVAVCYTINETVNSPLQAEKKHVYMRWTKDTVEKISVDNGVYTIIESNPNPYGVIPIVAFSTTIGTNSYWPDRGQPIVEMNENLNLHMTQFMYGLTFQEFSQAVVRGLETKDKIRVGPDKPVVIPPNLSGETLGDFKFETPSPAIHEVWEILNNSIPAGLAASMGVSKEVFLSEGSKFSSGYQLKLARAEVMNRSRQDRAYYRKSLIELVQIMMMVYNANSGATRFPDGVDLLIDFPEQRTDLDPVQREQLRALKIANGTWSPIRSLMEDNPDLTYEEAVAEYQRIKAENATYTIPVLVPATTGGVV